MMETMRRRAAGDTELSLCRAVPGGTGITVLALLLSKQPDLQVVQSALRSIQKHHPILRSKLHYSPTTRSFSFLTPPASTLLLGSFIFQSESESDSQLSPFEKLVEHELNLNPWKLQTDEDQELMEAKVYELQGCGRWAVVLKAHTAACDRAAGEAILRDLVRLVGGGGEEEEEELLQYSSSMSMMKLGIEEYVPSGLGKRSMWARGVNMLAYSLNSLRLANIDFVDTHSPRSTRLLRLRLHPQLTTKLLQGCRSREIKLCGALAAASLIAARRSSKPRAPAGQRDKYGVATIVDCRSLLHPPLNAHHAGFYHTAIINTHEINGREQLWQLAERTYTSFNAAKTKNKHLSEMGDLNFLMRRALENPGLTPSSALRTSFVSVFEDEILHQTEGDKACQAMGVQDYMGSSSVHGVGPTLALFPTIRDGGLDCGCLYPGPLHSTHQMHALLDHIKSILVDAAHSTH